MHVCRRPVAARGAVNTTPSAVAVYIALTDRRYAVAKFSKSRIWDKVPGEVPLFLDIPKFPKTQAVGDLILTMTDK